MPLITPNKYNNPCFDFLEDNQTNASDEFRDIDSSEANDDAGAAVARPAKALKPMPWYQKLVHRPNYYGPRSPTPVDHSLNNPTPPFFKQKKTSWNAQVSMGLWAFGSSVSRSPETRARPQSTKSGQASNTKAQKWVGYYSFCSTCFWFCPFCSSFLLYELLILLFVWLFSFLQP